MRLPICQFFLDFEGLPEEEFEVGGGLACESLWRMQGIMNALYEYLSDTPAGVGVEITVPGHRHGRDDFDGVYINRSGTAHAAWLPYQSCSASSGSAYFEVLDRAMPQDGGESACNALNVDSICFYCRRDYLALQYRCRARVSDAQTEAWVRMTIRDATGALVTQDECAVDHCDWSACDFVCALSGDEECEGWLQMSLE